MRIAVLCNDRVALPAIDQLLHARILVATGMSAKMSETQAVVNQRCAQAKVPLRLFAKTKLKEDLLQWLDEYRPDVVLVKTFPYRIPEEVIARPKYGFINFHYAPLPQWRGPNPLFWMIRQRETTGGVTVHRMNAAFDEGPVLLQQVVPCSPGINFGLFYTQLAYAGANLTGALLYGLQNGTLQEKEQDHTQAKWYGRPQASDLFIDWKTMSADEIQSLVNACNPWNKGAATRSNGWVFGITHTSISNNTATDGVIPGTILSVDRENGFRIATTDERIIIAEVVYCEEGFYPGYCMGGFGLKKHDQLT